MPFKCNLVKVDPSVSEGKQLLEQTESLLNELIGMGLKVEERVAQEYGDIPVISIFEAPSATSKRAMLWGTKEVITPNNIAELIRLRDYHAFICELEKQKARMSLLGWTVGIWNRKITITMSGGRFSDINVPQLSDIHQLRQDLTHAECRNELHAHMEEFERAGIAVSVYENCFKLVLRENDPELVRNLTPENVKEIISIAKALAH